MSTTTLIDADVGVREAVLEQLEWDPQVNASAIGVTASGGTVTLTGFIDSCAGKLAAERAAKRVDGVRAVANDIEVRLRWGRTDADIAADVTRALEANDNIPRSVQAAVHKSRVTLTGKVDWIFQKTNAEKAVRHVHGVRSVADYISVAPCAAADVPGVGRVDNRAAVPPAPVTPPDEIC